ncbi:MAG: CoA pyrophosphatase [Chloroflexota bacterium]
MAAERIPAGDLVSALVRGLPPPRTTRVDFDSRPAPDPDGRTAAGVLLLVYPHTHPDYGAEAPHLVLTRRTDHLPRHRGQISLPGGRLDPHDPSLLATALRETHEELGVHPSLVTVLGRLQPVLITASHYVITPFVATASQRPSFAPAHGEVAEVIDVPLAHLLDPATLQEEVWDLRGAERLVSFFRYREHKIWGATARVLGQLIELIDPTFRARHPNQLPPGGVSPESQKVE